jgi:iron complex transport system ATP-binding protein
MDAPLIRGLTARQLSVHVGMRTLVRDLSVEFAPGEVVAILGCNGSGKTLTLHTLAGLRSPHQGAVHLDGMPFDRLTRRAVALRLGLLAQDIEDAFVTTALEMVLIGRHPHLSLWQWETAEDVRISRESLAAVGLGEFADRRTDTLSGGEQRRVAVAALLAQRPGIFLLDEPTNHLDPHHQIGVLGLFRELARAGSTVITTLHDPTLAARFADRVLLLFGDGRWSAGPVRETLTAAGLSALYDSPMIELEKDGRRVFVSA